jgi:alpha-mannosidase
VAWFATHHHDPAGANAPYDFSYLFAFHLGISEGAANLTLPDNPAVRIFAVSASSADQPIILAQDIYT